MADSPGKPSGLTARQEKWLSSMASSLQRDTGKTLDEWIAIARTCPETKPRARALWFKELHGLGINRAMQVFSAAFPEQAPWNQPADEGRQALWRDPASAAILAAFEAAALELQGVVVGQRKSFTAFSRDVQFAALQPLRGGQAMAGFALAPDADPRLEAPKNESWSERLKARMTLVSAANVDATVKALLRQAWERS